MNHICLYVKAAFLLATICILSTLVAHYRTISQSPQGANSVIRETGVITNCITKRVLGRVPDGLESSLLDEQVGTSVETGKQRKASFKMVFQMKGWGGNRDENYKGIAASGPGSTLSFTHEVSAGLHQIIGDFKLQMGVSRVRLLDIPCGDMAWMSRFLKTRDDVDYTGMDIVPELIGNHTKSFKEYPWKFRLQDIVEQPLNKSYDIILCRMMLQHLYTRDVLEVLKKFSDSGSRYLLTTTHYTFAKNTDLSKNPAIDRFRWLNLEIPPISLVPPKCMFRDGEEENPHGSVHFLGLWELPLRRITDCLAGRSFSLTARHLFYSCTEWAFKL